MFSLSSSSIEIYAPTIVESSIDRDTLVRRHKYGFIEFRVLLDSAEKYDPLNDNHQDKQTEWASQNLLTYRQTPCPYLLVLEDGYTVYRPEKLEHQTLVVNAIQQKAKPIWILKLDDETQKTNSYIKYDPNDKTHENREIVQIIYTKFYSHNYYLKEKIKRNTKKRKQQESESEIENTNSGIFTQEIVDHFSIFSVPMQNTQPEFISQPVEITMTDPDSNLMNLPPHQRNRMADANSTQPSIYQLGEGKHKFYILYFPSSDQVKMSDFINSFRELNNQFYGELCTPFLILKEIDTPQSLPIMEFIKDSAHNKSILDFNINNPHYEQFSKIFKKINWAPERQHYCEQIQIFFGSKMATGIERIYSLENETNKFYIIKFSYIPSSRSNTIKNYTKNFEGQSIGIISKNFLIINKVECGEDLPITRSILHAEEQGQVQRLTKESPDFKLIDALIYLKSGSTTIKYIKELVLMMSHVLYERPNNDLVTTNIRF